MDDGLADGRVCAFLGKTTGVLYHHYGSLDGFLFAVSQSGIAVLRARLQRAFDRHRSLGDVAEAFVEFGLEHPELYGLMFERKFDWKALRAQGAFRDRLPGGTLWEDAHALLEAAGSTDPATDARTPLSPASEAHAARRATMLAAIARAREARDHGSTTPTPKPALPGTGSTRLDITDRTGDSSDWQKRALGTLNDLLGQCYDLGRAEDANLAGNITVQFTLVGEPWAGRLP